MDLTALPLAEIVAFNRPAIDWHGVAPELILLGFGALLTLVDVIFLDRARKISSALAGIALLATMVPILTLANDISDSGARVMFDGAYVIDEFSLIMKAVFILSGYVVILLSTNYIAEGDYWESEYYGLLLTSILGMVVMSSSRDLISIFVAFELLSIPSYMLATWKKRSLESNEAGLKYYLMGVFASAIMLYGMSLLFGVSGETILTKVNASLNVDPLSGEALTSSTPIITLGVIFVIVGFAFKVSAVPFHNWAPDTYSGAPIPVTAFLAVASKIAGFVALVQLVFVGFYARADVFEPLMWILAVASMTIGNLIALRQTDIVRLMAYSGVAQAGFILAPLAVAGQVGDQALSSVVTYLAIYAAMNLGAFAVILAAARKTGSTSLDSMNGLFSYAPGLAIAMTIFMFALAGIPPLGGWFAKFEIFFAVVEAGGTWAILLGVALALNSVIALYYYANIARRMWAEEAPNGDLTPIRVPASLSAALVLTVVVTLVFGFLPGAVSQFTDVGLIAGG